MQSERGFEYGVKHIISPRSGELRDVLLSILDIDPEQTNFLLDLGSIYHQHKRLREALFIHEGDYLRIHTKPRRFPAQHIDWPSRLVFQNENFMVLNKPSGLPVHASVDNIKENLQNYAQDFFNTKLYVTHRLDVPTSGLILYAKTLEFQSLFNSLMAERKIHKFYRCLTENKSGGTLKTGIMTHYMQPSPRAPKVIAANAVESNWQECILDILNVEHQENSQNLVSIQLHTGRTHQIRTQLAFEGHPIVNDHTYGANKISEDEKIALQAQRLEFQLPSGEAFKFELENFEKI